MTKRRLGARFVTSPMLTGLILTGVLFCASCSKRDSGPPRFPVAGVLTYQGQPVPDARISFTCEKLRVRLAADTNPDGTFEIRTGTGVGLPAGEYALTVRPAPGGDEEVINMNRPDIPRRYWTSNTSDLTHTVAEGQDSIELSLSDQR